jgi:hypothetical protein
MRKRAVNSDRAKWFMGEGSLPSFSVAEVQSAGLNLIRYINRTEVLTAEKASNPFKKESDYD